jgi:hypothetical protein
MRPFLGDFLALASEHIDTASSDSAPLPPGAACAVVCELGRVTAAMARYPAAFVLHDETDAAHHLDAPARAVRDATTALRFAAVRMRAAVGALGDDHGDQNHPAAARLSAAAGYLSAGHDLLQAHFAPGPFGSRIGASPWAPVIVSAPVSAALVAEMGRYAGRLAPWAIRLPAARGPSEALPARTQVAISAACQWLRMAEAAAWATGHHRDGVAAGRAVLRAIPANVVPPRHLPAGGEPVPALCAGVAATAERLRHLAHAAAARRHPPEATASTSWQRTAQGAAITAHCGELLLHRLTEPAVQGDGTLTALLRQAAGAASQARAAWRAAAHAWDSVTTGTGAGVTPAAAAIGDLVLWAGRLTYHNPAWTPARGQAGPVRSAVGLAGTPGTLADVLTALHEISDVCARIAAADRESVRAAAAAGALYVPTRLLAERCDVPYRYTPLLPDFTDALLATYDATIQAATRAATALDSVMRIVNPQRSTLATLRAGAQLGTPHLPYTPAVPVVRQAAQPAPGRVEQALRSYGISEPALLARATSLDGTTQDLINAARATAQRQATARRATLHPPEGPARGPQHPAALAAKDSPVTTGSTTPLPRLVPIGHRIRHSSAPRQRPTL